MVQPGVAQDVEQRIDRAGLRIRDRIDQPIDAGIDERAGAAASAPAPERPPAARGSRRARSDRGDARARCDLVRRCGRRPPARRRWAPRPRPRPGAPRRALPP